VSYTVAGLINAADVCEEVKREDERPLADPEQLRAHAALIEENARLKSAIRWALGYDEGEPQFGEQQGGPGMYSWRKELRRRADFPKEPR